MIKSSFSILFYILLFSCGRSTDPKANQLDVSPVQDTFEETDTVATIKFEDFTLKIVPFEIWDEEHALDSIQKKDTVFIEGAVGAVLGDARIRIIGLEHVEDLKIEQCYETTLGIYDEESVCILYDWKHYYSPWKTLRQAQTGVFDCIGYTIKEEQMFPPVSSAELTAAVKKYCSEQWWDQAKNPHTYPCEVGISTYFLRVSGKIGGKPFIKYVSIDKPMNC